VEVSGNNNLLLLPGHIGLAEYETTLGIAQELSGSLLALRNLPGSIRFLLNETAVKYDVDFVLVDMSPSLGPLNQNLLTTSDYFIVPLHPDYFSSMALSSLAKVLPRWKSWANTAFEIDALQQADYPFPEPHIMFIGAAIQKYRPRLGHASKAFQRWIDQLKFMDCLGTEPWIPLLEVADFNSLIALSQEHQVPVYALTSTQTGQVGAVWDQTVESMKVYQEAFSVCADRVFKLTEKDDYEAISAF
jgi:hypothetical protein